MRERDGEIADEGADPGDQLAGGAGPPDQREHGRTPGALADAGGPLLARELRDGLPALARIRSGLVRGELLPHQRLDLGDGLAERLEIVGERGGERLHEHEPADATGRRVAHWRE